MTDIAFRLKTTADMIFMGDRITWGSDVELMREAADEVERLRRERDEARARNAQLALQLHDEKMRKTSPSSALLPKLERAEAERDEARARALEEAADWLLSCPPHLSLIEYAAGICALRTKDTAP